MIHTLTIDSVRESIQELYRTTAKPRADDVQEILDHIERVKDEKTRTLLFTTAKQYLMADLKDLAIASRARAMRAWGDLTFSAPKT